MMEARYIRTGRMAGRRDRRVTYAIAEPCTDVVDLARAEECLMDGTYECGRVLYVHPGECMHSDAGEPVCPGEAIPLDDDVPPQWPAFIAGNTRFFAELLLGREAPLSSPYEAAKLGRLGVDTELVAGYLTQRE